MTTYRDALDEAPVVVAAFHGSVFGLDAKTGELRWTCRLSGGGVVRLCVSRTFVLALRGASLMRCAYETGRHDWEVKIPFTAEAMLVRDDRVFVAGAGEIACLSLATGALAWRNAMKGEGLESVALALPFESAQVDRVS